MYLLYSSFTKHMAVKHKDIVLDVVFQCASCEFTHSSRHSISVHFVKTHGAATPPIVIDGSKEKACPYCPLTFPSNLSCSHHIREHGVGLCAARASRGREGGTGEDHHQPPAVEHF